MNPPYGKGIGGISGGASKGTGKTKINQLMLNEGWGKGSENLYSQFLYKIYLYSKHNINICLFSPPLFLSGTSFKSFRTNFFKKYYFVKGFIMDAANFADVKSWGLSFSILSSKK